MGFKCLNKKGIFYIFRTIIDFIKTKIFFKDARLIRHPIDIRGKKYIKFGEKLTTGRYCRIEAMSNNNKKSLKLGNDIQINDNVHITAFNSIIIEDNVLVASKVYISDTSHGKYNGDNQSLPEEIVEQRELYYKKVHISKNVWLGESVSVLPGVFIGENSIIGANSVVTKDIPNNSIAVGSPAKVIKKFNYKSKKWEETT